MALVKFPSNTPDAQPRGSPPSMPTVMATRPVRLDHNFWKGWPAIPPTLKNAPGTASQAKGFMEAGAPLDALTKEMIYGSPSSVTHNCGDCSNSHKPPAPAGRA